MTDNLKSVPVPTGVAEFHAWAEGIANDFDLPTKNLDSIKFTLATIIMHLGPQDDEKPREWFVKTLRAGAAKQVASQIFQEIKQKHADAEAAARAKEVTSEVPTETI